MTVPGWDRRHRNPGPRPRPGAAPLWAAMAASACLLTTSPTRAQAPNPLTVGNPAVGRDGRPALSSVITSSPAPTTVDVPGAAVVGGPVVVGGPEVVAGPEVAALAADVQVVRFQGPAGVKVEVLGPDPEPVPIGDGHGLLTVGLRVGTGYRLRLSDLPDRPGVELFPVVEVVGHLHRPAGIDPGKYPIRVAFTEADFIDAADHNRLVTQVIYLEDPEQALPISLPKDEIPVVSLNPAEQPLKVAAALGRVMAVVRVGGRRPSPEEMSNGSMGPGAAPLGGPCPFTEADGARCPVACGPASGTPPPPGRPWLPRDEFLCDGGDHAEPAHFGGDGGLSGIDPRDAVIQFDDGRRPRALPTNTVCVYAPRFSEVRLSLGPNENTISQSVVQNRYTAKEVTEAVRQGPKKLVLNQTAESARRRDRASGLGGNVRAGVHGDERKPAAYDNSDQVAIHRKAQGAVDARQRQVIAGLRERQKFLGIKTAESAVITGITEGAGQTVMSWVPRETVGVEVPPARPGLAVIKRVSAGEAEAGDVLTYVIQYRNMGNTPINAVTVVDSLLPRLGYVKGTAQGPRGTAFTVGENRAGSTELKWVLAAPVPPGVEGHVSFQAVVR